MFRIGGIIARRQQEVKPLVGAIQPKGQTETPPPTKGDEIIGGERIGALDGGPTRGRSVKLLQKDYVLVCAAAGVLFASFYLQIGTIPLYLKDLGEGDFAIGVVLAAFTLAAMVGRILVGPALDSWGRRSLFIAGSFLFFLAIVAYNLMPDTGLMVIIRVFQGLGFAAMTTAAATLVADVAPAGRIGEAMGYYGMANIVAMGLAPGAGLTVLQAQAVGLSGFPLLFIIGSVIAALSFALTVFIGEPRRQKVPPELRRRLSARSFFARGAIPAAVANFFTATTYGAVVTFLPLYAGPENIQNVAIFFMIYSVVVMVSRPLAGIAADRIGRRMVVIPSMALAACGISVFAMAPSLTVVAVGAVIYGLGFGAAYPALMALAVDFVPAPERGAAMGTFGSSYDFGIAVGTMGLGLVAQFAGYPATFLTAGGLALLGLVYFISYPRFIHLEQLSNT